MNTPRNLLFVYGTLRRDGINSITKQYPNSFFIGSSFVNGRLYDMGGYPAIILNETAGAVIGEVYKIDDATFRALDEFEANDDYHRELISVSVDGKTIECWIYRPRPELCEDKPRVESGDWIAYSN